MPRSKMAPVPGEKPITTVTKIEGPVTSANIEAMIAQVTSEASTATEAALEACTTDCSAEVIKTLVVTLVNKFTVPCASLPTAADYKATYAAAMSVEASSVVVEILSATGCSARLLANGERRLATGEQEVQADVSYPEDKGADVVSVTGDAMLSKKLSNALAAEKSLDASEITSSVVSAPSVGVSTQVAVSTSQAPTSAPTTMDPTAAPSTVAPTSSPTMATASPTLAPSNATEAPTNVTEEESRAALTSAGLVTVAVTAFSMIATAL